MYSSRAESSSLLAQAGALCARLITGKFRLVARVVEALAEATGVQPRIHIEAERAPEAWLVAPGSTERVAEQSLARAREIGLNVHMLPAWYDVDDIDGLRRLQTELRDCEARTQPQNLAAPHHAVHAAKLMNEFVRDRDFGRLGARALEIDEMRA